MNIFSPRAVRPLAALALACLALLGSACNQEDRSGFKLNLVYQRVQEKNGGDAGDYNYLANDLQTVLVSLFGTSNEPRVPQVAGVDITQVIDEGSLQMAAGKVRQDEFGNHVGLFREHCAHCHGVTGDGAGPTAAFLNPYPRDFRYGVFKFKSTPKGEKPTHDDLRQILLNGIPGTAMPSFALLKDTEVEALVNYVKYLSIRGEVERRVIDTFADLEEGERYLSSETTAMFADHAEELQSAIASVVSRWQNAPAAVVEIPTRAPGWNADEATRQASIARGRELFFGDVAACVKCHGQAALGDGQTNDYDDWTKFPGGGFIPQNADAETIHKLTNEFVSLGALAPRNIRPRNLRSGVYRGGRRPIDLYWRLINGIDGTPMPGVPMLKPGAPPGTKGLTEEDLWSLIDYVRNLPLESASQPPPESHQEENLRERF